MAAETASLDRSIAPSSDASACRLWGGTRPAGRGPSSYSAGWGAPSLTAQDPAPPRLVTVAGATAGRKGQTWGSRPRPCGSRGDGGPVVHREDHPRGV